MSNTMLRGWESFSQAIGDLLCGWLLQLPRDASLLGLAMLTAALTLLLRWAVSDQQQLACVRGDRRRLAEFIRAARRGGDRELLDRCRRTRSRIVCKRVMIESRLAVISLLPLAVLVSWGSARLHYQPPVCGQPIDFVLFTPASAVGSVAHLVPQTKLKLPQGWIREVELIQRNGNPRGRALWSLFSDEPRGALTLEVRVQSRTVAHSVSIGTNRYAAPDLSHAAGWQSRVILKPYRPLGWYPGVAGLPPWLTGYLTVVAAVFSAAKRMLGVE